jgi:hypothetical protein
MSTPSICELRQINAGVVDLDLGWLLFLRNDSDVVVSSLRLSSASICFTFLMSSVLRLANVKVGVLAFSGWGKAARMASCGRPRGLETGRGPHFKLKDLKLLLLHSQLPGLALEAGAHRPVSRLGRGSAGYASA